MTAWIVFLVYMEIYSVGVTVLAKKSGMQRYGLCLIPFVSFFFVDRITGGFSVCGIRVRSMGKLVVKLAIVCLFATVYAYWGLAHLAAEDSAPLVQVMWVPAAFSMVVFWLATVFSAVRILFLFRASFRLDWLVCALFVTVPFLFMFMPNRGERVGKSAAQSA